MKRLTAEELKEKILAEIRELEALQNTPTQFMPKILSNYYTNETLGFFASNNIPQLIHPSCAWLANSLLEARKIKEAQKQFYCLFFTALATAFSAVVALIATFIAANN